MSIPSTLQSYLKEQSVDFALVRHPHTGASMDTAQAAHVPGDHLAKGVVVSQDGRYLLVVVPADYHVHLGRLHEHLGEPVGLATEAEVAGLFPDCEPGAVPPIGGAYALRTLVDRHLMNLPEVYFESGDHEHLVKISGDRFADLMRAAEVVDVGRHL
ncbi:aminoacyl-tRNA deacylase [Thiocapsa bogorovii]|uniref:aminoacyl-tRNA deacylase n=1 Tax=Thiocapsa bogorovii TaxID=521689 RepID=UPI001E4720BE|nr:YbaK/EbsC family protein [Thiocapsa bogorovii]UHD14800.1 YbaK/EbsC family protein [Thiocapsa bogorovii]